MENKHGRQALKGTWVFCSQTCCLMGLTLERVSVNSVLCLSQHGPEQYRCRVEIWNWDGQEIVGKNKTNKHTKKKTLFCYNLLMSCYIVIFGSDLMDASTGLGQRKQTNANQQQGDEHKAMAMAAADRPSIGSDQGHSAFSLE